MTMQLTQTVASYIRAINDHDATAFIALFADDATVRDIGREFHGMAAIRDWSDREIFDVQVTLDAISVADRDGETVLLAKVDGTFDRTGLPDPLILEHDFRVEGGKITELTCKLAVEKPAS
jgi:hypothetical protein